MRGRCFHFIFSFCFVSSIGDWSSFLLASFWLCLNAEELKCRTGKQLCVCSRLGLAALEALREANGDSLQGICKCFPPQGREKTFQAVVGNSAEFFSCRFSKRRAFPVLLCGRRNDGRTGQEGKRRLMCYCLLPR